MEYPQARVNIWGLAGETLKVSVSAENACLGSIRAFFAYLRPLAGARRNEAKAVVTLSFICLGKLVTHTQCIGPLRLEIGIGFS